MTAKASKSNSSPGRDAEDSKGSKRIWWLAGIMVIALIAFLYARYAPLHDDALSGVAQQATSQEKVAKPYTPDVNQLTGRWLRPDGGYILEIRSAAPDGTLDVGYFNPKSIHVARAAWVEKDAKLYVMAELQDVNCPGSTYGLEYIPGQDKLAGTYFQAVEKSTYDVEFVREQSK